MRVEPFLIMIKTVKLSDGEEASVGRLPIFGLDKVPIDVLGPYTYEISLLTGKTLLAEYDGSLWATPPPKPDSRPEELTEGPEDWYNYREWALYQSWLVHERERMTSIEMYHYRVATYILENCLDDETRRRIVTADDWQKVYQAAISPEVTAEHLAVALRQTFQGNF
jgi:hypothetical protein